MYESERNCVIAYVFGKVYQAFIPYYVYSMLKIYVDIKVILYIDRELDKDISRQISKYFGGGLEIRYINYDKLGLSDMALRNEFVLRAGRWFLIDDDLLDFDNVYIGDIDIFICKEENSLFDEHVRHSKYINLPYSNVVRSIHESRNVRHIIGNMVRHGVKAELYNSFLFSKRDWYLLSGLHFMRMKKYGPAIKEAIPGIIKEINNSFLGKSKVWNEVVINDESILYELINLTGLGIPDYDGERCSGQYIVENLNPETIGYRPHHGLHLKLFQDGFVYDSNVTECKTYKMYYEYFRELYENDIILHQLMKQDNIATYQIKNMINYYSIYEGNYGKKSY